MPIVPRPVTFTCPACHWKRSVAPKSDCLTLSMDWFECCPKCYHTLERRQASALENIAARIRSLAF